MVPLIPLAIAAAVGIGTSSIAGNMAHNLTRADKIAGRKRPTAADYEPKAITVNRGMPVLDPLNPLKGLSPLKGLTLNKLVPLQDQNIIDPFRPRKETYYQTPKYNELTDPLQVNSLSDVLLNQEGRDIVMQDRGLSWVDRIPGIGWLAETLVVAVDYLAVKHVQPVLEGNFGKAFMNAANAFGEDTDTFDFANVVKGLVIDENKGQSVMSAMGFGQNGRRSYNFDTGNGWKDLGLELVYSPSNWLTLGAAAAFTGVKSLSKSAIKTSAARIAKEVGEDVTSEAVQSIVKRATRIAIDTSLDSKAANKAVKSILNDYVSQSITKESVAFSRAFAKQFKKDLADIVGSKTMYALKIIKPMDELQDRFTGLALKFYATGGTYPFLHKTVDGAISALKTSTLRALSAVISDVKGVKEPNISALVDGKVLRQLEKEQAKAVKIGRLKYGDQLDFLNVFGNTQEVDDRFIGILRKLSDIEDPEEMYKKFLQILKDDIKTKGLPISFKTLKQSAALKDFVIGTAEADGILLKTASAKEATEDALESVFLNMRPDIIKKLVGAKTNLEAYLRLERFFIDRGNTISGWLDFLEKKSKELGPDARKYLAQKEFLESLLDEFGTNRKWLDQGGPKLRAWLEEAAKGSPKKVLENAQKMLGLLDDNIRPYKPVYSIAKKAITKFNNLFDEEHVVLIALNKMLGDTTVPAANKKVIRDLLSAVIDDRSLDELMQVYTKNLKLIKADGDLSLLMKTYIDEANIAAKNAEDILNRYSEFSRAPVSEYSGEQALNAIELEGFDTLHNQLKSLKSETGKVLREDKGLISAFQKLLDNPKALTSFDAPLTAPALMHALDKVIIKRGDAFLEELKQLGIVHDILEDLPEEDVKHVVKDLISEDEFGLNKIERIDEALKYAIFDKNYSRKLNLEDAFDDAFMRESIDGGQKIKEDFEELFSYRGVVTKETLVSYMDTLEDVINDVTYAIQSFKKKIAEGQDVANGIVSRFIEIEGMLQEQYVPLLTYINVSALRGKAYSLKQLQFFNRIENMRALTLSGYQGNSTLDILADIASEKPNTIIGGIVNALAKGSATDEISDNFKVMAQQIQRRCQSTVNYLKLQEQIYALPTVMGLESATLDMLENFNREAPGSFSLTKEQFVKELEQRCITGENVGKMKLENYYNEHVAHKYKGKLRAHNAVDDRIMQVRILQHQLDSGFLELPEGKVFVSFDIETTGLSLAQAKNHDASIVQISAARYKIQNGQIVQTGKPFLMYGKPKPEHFISDDLKEILGTDTLAKAGESMFSTEQILEQFDKYVGNRAVAGHNIIDYDLPYIKALSGPDDMYLDNLDTIDTLKIMRDTEFKSPLYSDENGKIFEDFVDKAYKTIQEYAEKQTALKMPFIYTVDRHLADEFHALFNPLDYAMTRATLGFSEADVEAARSWVLGKANTDVDFSRKNLPEGTDTMQIQDGTSMIQNLRQVLIDTKNTNKELARYVITTDKLPVNSNIYAFMYGSKDGFVLNKYATKTLYNSAPSITILTKMPEEGLNVVGDLAASQFTMKYNRYYENLNLYVRNYSKQELDIVRDLLRSGYKNSVWLDMVELDNLSMYQLFALNKTLIAERGGRAGFTLTKTDQTIQDFIYGKYADKGVMFIKDPELLAKSFDILQDPLSSNTAIDQAIFDIRINGADQDMLRLIDYMQKDYSTFAKDPNSFDVEWHSKVMRGEFENNFTFCGDARRAILARQKVDPDLYKQFNAQRIENYTHSILNLEPDSLMKYMHEHGYVMFLKQADFETFATDIAHIVDNKAAYEAMGVGIKQEDDVFVLYLKRKSEAIYETLTTDVPYKLHYKAVLNKEGLDESMLDFLDAYEKNHKAVDGLTPSPFDAYNSSYNTVNGETYGYLTKDLKLNGLVGPEYRADFYGRVYQIDCPILGTADTIRTAFPHASLDAVNAQVGQLTQSLKLGSARTKYIQFLFNDDTTLNRNVLWNSMTDEQVLKIFTGNKNMACVVLYEKNGKTMARKIRPTSLAHIAEIRRLNGNILPADLANKVTGTINEFDKMLKENHPWIAKWREYVVSTYKTIYLTSLGFLTRNGLDIIIKNTATLDGGPLEIPRVLRTNLQAFRMWGEYSKTVAMIMESTKNGGLTSIAIDRFFRLHPEMDRRIFEFVHRYATSSASAGMAQAQQELVKKFNLTKNGVKQNAYRHLVFENALVKNLMSANAYIEHSGRLGLLLASIEDGKVFDDAIQDVLRTHFDYSNLSLGELYAETIIPFVTFPIRNLEYWNDAIKGNGWLIELLVDATMETNQLHSQSQFMLDNSRALQNAIMSGNVRTANSIYKLSPSAFDAARLIMSPADMTSRESWAEGEINRRVIAPLRLTEGKDSYGDVIDNATKRKEYLRNVLAIYQWERTAQVGANVASLAGINIGTPPPVDPKDKRFFQVNEGNMNNLADIVPSMVGEKSIKPGNMTGDMRYYKRLPNGSTLETIVDARERVGAGRTYKVLPRKAGTRTYSSRIGYSSQRIPYTKRYYSPSYNFYNRWRAENAARANAARHMPATAESLTRRISNVFYMNNLTPIKMNYLITKQRRAIR